MQVPMAFNVRSRMEVACPFGMSTMSKLYPHVVQVALATDCVRALGKDGGAIVLKDLIAT